MSRCLKDDEVQAIADNEGGAEHRAHAAQCPSCAGAIAARISLNARVADATGRGELPADVRAAIRSRLDGRQAAGATTLRAVRRMPRWGWALPIAASAAVILLVVVLPGIDRRTTVSAAEVLGRSRTALAAPVAGVEVLTYDLEVAGVLGDLIPAEQAGRFSVQEIVDHDHEGRYRVVKLSTDGRIVAGAADDPVRGTRARYMRANGRGYLLRFVGAPPTTLSLPALKRAVLQTLISLMQVSRAQTMREIERSGESCYEIDIPGNGVAIEGILTLDRARAVVTAAESRLLEFSAAGRVADRPFTLDFALRARQLRPAGAAVDADFDITAAPGDAVLEGNASDNPLWDVVTRALEAIPRPPGARN